MLMFDKQTNRHRGKNELFSLLSLSFSLLLPAQIRICFQLVTGYCCCCFYYALPFVRLLHFSLFLSYFTSLSLLTAYIIYQFLLEVSRKLFTLSLSLTPTKCPWMCVCLWRRLHIEPKELFQLRSKFFPFFLFLSVCVCLSVLLLYLYFTCCW